MESEIIIVGAGAAGLLAARELSRAGRQVLVLEARNRIGGRINTLHDEKFSRPIELGAEFLHGKTDLSNSLLNEYEIKYHEVTGRFYRKTLHGFREDADMMENASLLEKKLRELETDVSVEDFLKLHFSGEEHEALRHSVTAFVEGYDAGDVSVFSTMALRQEWLNDDWHQYRIEGGYGALAKKIAEDAQSHGAHIAFNEIVKSIKWSRGEVNITAASGNEFSAKKVIITVPVGVLCCKGKTASISFEPPIPEYNRAAAQLGYGAVIKIILQCDKAFWKEWEYGGLSTLGFLFSNSSIPTWWTQLPDESPILSGWMGGKRAKDLELVDDQKILELAYDSLQEIFGKSVVNHILSASIGNWAANPYTLGAYSFAKLGQEKHIEVLQQPVEDTIYFAGEALNIEFGNGTVEGAFRSAMDVVKKVQREHVET